MKNPNLPAFDGGLWDLSAVPVPGAVLSPNGEYRYLLTRDLLTPFDRAGCPEERTVLFVMANPSTADATADDNTIRRCIDYGQRWGYTQLWVCNLSPFRSTDPKDLKRHGRDLTTFRTPTWTS